VVAAEVVRGRAGRLAPEPTETDRGTICAYLAGPHGVVVKLYQSV
jgi:hypothetical protein